MIMHVFHSSWCGQSGLAQEFANFFVRIREAMLWNKSVLEDWRINSCGIVSPRDIALGSRALGSEICRSV
jgi:hypothetical protein